MLRSRSVSSRSIRRSASCFVLVATLLLAAPASAAPSVVVAGPEGSARVRAIAAELQARGFDAVIAEAPDAAGADATVHVGRDGSVDVRAGDRRETFPAADGDAVLARRVAETLRAVEPVAPAPAPPAPPAPEVEPPPPPPEAPPSSPSRDLARAGTWLLSVDDALPLLAVGGFGAPLSSSSVVRVGDPAYGASTAPKPLSVDVAVLDRVTLGGTLLLQVAERRSILGGGVRVGYVLPLGDRLALWPRIGVSNETSLSQRGSDSEMFTRTDLDLEVRLVWAATPSWALTVGPSLGVAMQKKFRPLPVEDALPASGAGLASGSFVVVAQEAPPRLGLSVGITGQIREASEARSAKGDPPPRVFFGVERAAPLLRLRVDTSSSKSVAGTKSTSADGGTADTTSIVPQTPRLAVDVRVGDNLTVGAAGSLGWVRGAPFSSSRALGPGSSETLAWAIAPRVGYHLPFSRSFAFWPRLGLTYANASSSHTMTDGAKVGRHHLGADLDTFVLFSPTPGVGVLIGPSLELPLTGARRDVSGSYDTSAFAYPTTHSEQTLVTLALTAGLVLTLP